MSNKGSQFYLSDEARVNLAEFSLRRGPSKSALVEAYALVLLGSEFKPEATQRVLDEIEAAARRIQHSRRDRSRMGR